MNTTARAALAKVLEPGEDVIQALSGTEVLYQTNRRLLTWSPSFAGTGVWSCPLELIERVSYAHTKLEKKAVIVSIDSYGHLRHQGKPHRRKVVVNDSPAVAAFPKEVIRAVNALLADPHRRQPLEVALEGATSRWTIPVVARVYRDDSTGHGLREAEIALFARHGYAPTASMGATGALKTKQLILTGGIGAAFSYARGKGGVHEIGTTTVTFAKVAGARAPALPSSASPGGPAIPAVVVTRVETKVCPECGGEVKATARLCHYCRYEFEEDVGNNVPMERPSMTGAGGTTTSEGPEHPDEVAPTTTPDPPRSLWEQPSFLVTVALCAVWSAVFLSGSKAAQAARPGAVIFLVLTIVGYAGYRKWRGWTALPRSGWLPSRNTSRRRWVGLGLYVVVVLSVAGGLATQPDSVLWTRSLNATTCGDWQSVMTDYQRHQMAQTLLDYDRLQTPMPADAATDSVSDYVTVITAMCHNDVGPSSLLFKSWEAGAPLPAP